MNWIERLKRRWKNRMQKTIADTGLAREYKSVFDLGGIPSFQQFYDFGIFIWKLLWKGYYKPWHYIPAPTIADPDAKRIMSRMGMAKAVCAEMAGLVWGEECNVNVSINGRESTDENTDPLNEFAQKVLTQNAFHEKMQESIEEGLALGGAALKTWAESRHDTDGNEIEGYHSGELFGNSIARPVDFEKSLTDLSGKEVRLKFEFSSCDLFSFIFE